MPKSKKENIEEITLDPIEEKVKEPAPVEEPVEEPVEPETIEEGEDITEPDAPIEPEFEEPEEGEQVVDVEFDEDAGEEETDEDAPEEDAPPFLGLMLGAKNVPVSEDPDPQSRIEALLWHIINGTTTDAVPQSRNEAILTAIANGGTYTAEAQSRIEALLIAILNHEEVNITPVSRNEAILKAIANSGEYDEEPQSRNEELLLKWLEAWGIVIETATGAVANFTTSLALPLVSVKSAIVATGGGGTPTSPIAINGFSEAVINHSGEDMTNPTIYTISLGQTVYGGEVDVKNGKLKLTHKKITLNGTQTIALRNWQPKENSVGFAYSADEYDGKRPTANNVALEGLISDQLTTQSYSQIYSGSVAWAVAVMNSNAYGIFVRLGDTSLTTDNLINAYLSEHPIEVVYPLATPIELDITPQEITALVGTNNLWSDTGDSTVEYKKKQTD